MKFIHAADIHLDSPLRGLSRYDGAPVEQMQSATRRAFVNLIDFACDKAVDFMLIAGDLYDVDWKDYNTGLFFNQQMTRLRKANISVFIILGNHDAGNVISRQLKLPDNVTVFSYNKPETKILDNLGVAIHGQSFANKAIKEDLTTAYPNAISGYFNIGLLHTALNGRAGHDNYAPCTIPGLLSHGYDYWALGHVHKQEILHENPWIVFSGNLQGRHVRETGDKGCLLVEVKNGKTTVKPIAVNVLRWEICQLDVSKLFHIDEIIEKAREAVIQLRQQLEDKTLALRFIFEGNSQIHNELHSNLEQLVNEIRTVVFDASLGNIWVEKINLRTQPVLNNIMQDEGPLEELGQFLKTLPHNLDDLQILTTELRSLRNALPLEARQNEKAGGIDPGNPDTILQSLNGVEELLISRLLINS
ncbi:MAG: metallophosphoesterase [Thiomargarita sp.]|nr:metallophosphoesterase [Thiomargarita sp.]